MLPVLLGQAVFLRVLQALRVEQNILFPVRLLLPVRKLIRLQPLTVTVVPMFPFPARLPPVAVVLPGHLVVLPWLQIRILRELCFGIMLTHIVLAKVCDYPPIRN
jgi:hypothetical protein